MKGEGEVHTVGRGRKCRDRGRYSCRRSTGCREMDEGNLQIAGRGQSTGCREERAKTAGRGEGTDCMERGR